MRKLRLILLILLVSICPLLWAASHVWRVSVLHSEAGLFGGDRTLFELHDGSFWCKVMAGASSPSWQLAYGYDKPHDLWYETESELYAKYCFLGFGYKPFAVDPALDGETPISLIRVPFWFLSGLAFLLGWWLWRLNAARLRLSLLVILVSICPLLWAWSYARWCGVQYADGARVFNVQALCGRLSYGVCEFPTSAGWGVWVMYVSPTSELTAPYSFCGFGVQPYRADPASSFPTRKAGFIEIPYWFLTCLGFLLGGWMWRRRGRIRKAEGFSPEAKPAP